MIQEEKLVDIYKKMMRIRKFEGKVAEVWAGGFIPGLVHLYVGEEAVAAGACSTLRVDDYITSTHRGHGHCIAKGGDLRKMMAELFGKRTGYCKGKGGSMHICVPEIGVVGCSGIVGAGIPIATGVGLSINCRGSDQVCVCFFGDGASNTGAFHEGINLAALWKLPVVFVCENNLYAISVSTLKSTSVKDIADRAAAYGIPGVVVDGMDAIAVFEAVHKAVRRARDGNGPTLIECKTYRFRGHFVGDPKRGGTYRTEEEMREWERRCPVKNLKDKLVKRKILTEKEAEEIEKNCMREVEDAEKFAKDSPYPSPNEVFEDLFVSKSLKSLDRVNVRSEKYEIKERELDFAEAINEALRQEMAKDESVILFGEDVGFFGGVFGCTKGLQREFGVKRVRDTPISEAAIVGAAIGSALTGMRPVAEIQFMDFIGCAMDQVFNQLAKMRYMFGGRMKVPVVVRVPCGSRHPVASGAAQHSQNLEAWFMHVPGLKVIIPSTPYDAKGLLIAAVRDDDPVLFIEHKLLYYTRQIPSLRERYPSLIASVPEEDYVIPFGKADVKREGEHVTVVATMMMVHKAMNASDDLAREGIEVEIVDPRTLVPLDKESIINSVKKTGRVVVASEDCKTAGVAAEITSIIMEEAFDYLDAPVKRVSALDIPIPYSKVLEEAVIPQKIDFVRAVKEVLG